MSRHRIARADIDDYHDDYYDFDDEYDDYDVDNCDEAGDFKQETIPTNMSSDGSVSFELPESSSTSEKTITTEQKFEEMVGFILEMLQRNGKGGEPGFSTHVTPATVRHTLRIYDNDINLVLDFFLKGGDSGSAGNERHPISDSKLKRGSLSTSSSEELHPSIQSIKLSSRKGTRLSKDMSNYDDLDGNDSVKKVGERNRSCNHGGYKCSTSGFVLMRDAGLQQGSNSSEVNILRSRSLSDENWLDSSPLSEAIDQMQIMKGKSELTMVVVGHVDAGKSTLIGNLLFQSGNVRKKVIPKYEKDGSKGNDSFHLAWVMDDDMSEREHGVTISVAERVLFTKSKKIVILDAPGHKDFIPNMINGATQADVALLVVPASTGEYESSMMVDSQTREHATLLKALGVNQIVVVVNKMDHCQWNESRFRFIENEVRTLLQSLQFRTKLMQFLPASGILAENLVELDENNPMRQWYKGITLLDAVDAFKVPTRSYQKPMRAIITAVVKEAKNTCDVNVKVLQGRLSKGRSVGIGNYSSKKTQVYSEGHASGKGLPFVADVKKISIEDNANSILIAGQNGTVSLQDRGGLSGESMSLKEGMVLYKGPPVLKKCRKFRAKIQTMCNLAIPIITGSVFDLHLHGEEMQCFLKKIYSVTYKRELIYNPKCIPAGSSAVVKIKTDLDAFIEVFDDCNFLGRFALRTRGVTSAVGICVQRYFSERN